MLAARYLAARTIEVGRGTAVEPGPGEVRLSVATTGICGTDLHVYHGAMDARVQVPLVLGHEMSGFVAETGPGVEGWSIGAPATVMPIAWCGQCPACRAGNTHVCHALNFIGIDSTGSMQTSWTVQARTLVHLPASLPIDLGALVEPTAVAVHDVGRATLLPGERTLVIGGGPVGLLIALVARTVGADVVIAEVNPYRRNVASGLGLRSLDPATADVAAFVADWTNAAGVDVAFEVSGTEAGVETAIQSLRVRGRLIVVGIHPKPALVNLHRVFWRELSIHGARVYERRDFEQAVALIASGAVPAQSLVSTVVPLSRAAEAFETLDAGGEVLKVLIDCREAAA
jgi:2-desacetyl-2-hydroxyethyl bacteriochlorophyllide A dehydrogenase